MSQSSLPRSLASRTGHTIWLFADTVAGAEASANLFSLIETAKANGLEPWAYLQKIFAEIPAAENLGDIEALLPQAVRASNDVLS